METEDETMDWRELIGELLKLAGERVYVRERDLHGDFHPPALVPRGDDLPDRLDCTVGDQPLVLERSTFHRAESIHAGVVITLLGGESITIARSSPE